MAAKLAAVALFVDVASGSDILQQAPSKRLTRREPRIERHPGTHIEMNSRGAIIGMDESSVLDSWASHSHGWDALEKQFVDNVEANPDTDFRLRWAHRNATWASGAPFSNFRHHHDHMFLSEPCPDGHVKLEGKAAEVVVSAFVEDLGWLSGIDNHRITVYVHNRHTHGTHFTKPYVEARKGDIERAERSQDTLQKQPRKYPITFVNMPNVGDEAAAYLKHIISRYDNWQSASDLKAIAFVMGSNSAWHMDDALSQKLPSTCFDPSMGYASLNSGHAFKGQSKCVSLAADKADAYDQEAKPVEADLSRKLRKNWSDLFESELGSLPETVCVDCCAQFVVSRERILQHPKDFYQKVLAAVLHGDTTMEREWRMVFVQRAMIGNRDSGV